MERDEEEERQADLPPGARALISPAGYARMTEERDRLLRHERPAIVEIVSWAAGNGDRSENGDYLYGKKRLREIDRRLRFLGKRLANADIVDPAAPRAPDRVYFGATVTYARESGEERTVTILGQDEADLARGEISVASPIARALLGARVGEEVVSRGPGGVETIEIVALRYPPPPTAS